mmetsp:Transcript_8542/g.22857  ORF Transcript_8542/g.22857 Transcript_8542/m.22857 type:complete len:108 (-) Transcript_8542:271-594(-)
MKVKKRNSAKGCPPLMKAHAQHTENGRVKEGMASSCAKAAASYSHTYIQLAAGSDPLFDSFAVAPAVGISSSFHLLNSFLPTSPLLFFCKVAHDYVAVAVRPEWRCS